MRAVGLFVARVLRSALPVLSVLLVLLVLGAGPADAQTVATPPQPVQTPAPPSPWMLIRGAASSTAAMESPLPLQAWPLAASPTGAGAFPPAAGMITLGEFLLRTLGRQSGRPYMVVPSVNPQAPVIAGDLGKLELSDPQALVRLVLQNLGLELTESSGVWIIQPRRAGEPMEDYSELWIYAPRNRPIHSLMPYFQNFPRLHFTFSSSNPTRPPDALNPYAMGGSYGAPGAVQTAWPAAEMTTSSAGGYTNGAAAMASGSSGAYGAGGLGGYSSYGNPRSFGAWSSPSTMGAMAYNTPPFSGNAAAISDPSFLVVRGHPQDIAVLQAFMEKVDVPVPEVQLRVYVLEVRDSENRNSAVQLLMNLLGGQITAQVGAVPTETNRLFIGGRDISMAISRLTADSRVRLVSSPTLRAADGSTASVTIGTDTPTLGSIVTFSGAVQQSVSYQSAGVLLNVSPHILNDTIRLMIWQELSSFAKTETGLTATPTKLRRAFRTDVVARNGEVLMLGGLSESTQVDNRQRGLLGLGSRSSENSTSEIVVLLQVLRL